MWRYRGRSHSVCVQTKSTIGSPSRESLAQRKTCEEYRWRHQLKTVREVSKSPACLQRLNLTKRLTLWESLQRRTWRRTITVSRWCSCRMSSKQPRMTNTQSGSKTNLTLVPKATQWVSMECTQLELSRVHVTCTGNPTAGIIQEEVACPEAPRTEEWHMHAIMARAGDKILHLGNNPAEHQPE